MSRSVLRASSRTPTIYDWATHEGTRQRNGDQIESMADPEFPATGTALVAARLQEARRRGRGGPLPAT